MGRENDSESQCIAVYEIPSMRATDKRSKSEETAT